MSLEREDLTLWATKAQNQWDLVKCPECDGAALVGKTPDEELGVLICQCLNCGATLTPAEDAEAETWEDVPLVDWDVLTLEGDAEQIEIEEYEGEQEPLPPNEEPVRGRGVSGAFGAD